MPPRTRTVPAGDENAAPEIVVADPTPEPEPTPEAEETGGAKMIRCRHNDEFVIDKNTRITGVWARYAATEAKRIIEAARVNGVALAVADVPKEG